MNLETMSLSKNKEVKVVGNNLSSIGTTSAYFDYFSYELSN
jgi:hypothetical protein